MATLEVDLRAADGAENGFPVEEDAVEEQPCEKPDRKHVDALLDISEEAFVKELEPFEFHCYNGWEEAVRGWARVDPMSCILLTPKTYRKAKHKEAATPTPVSANPATPSNADNSSSTAKHHCESHVGLKGSFQKSTQLNQHMGSWSNTAVAVLQKEAPEWTVINALQETTSTLLFREKVEQEEELRKTPHFSTKHSVFDNRPSKPQKHSHRPTSTVVPIKNFTFLPPIKPPQRNSGNRASEGETTEENIFPFDNKSRTRGTRMDTVANPELPTYSAGLTSKYRTCQHNPHMFSAVSVLRGIRYQRLPNLTHCTAPATQWSHAHTAPALL
ncbi:uncharacterized protein C16orf46 homolog [Labrus mixtus]|uniref:uncharacterized protein C16orf46 homolog n=1 Tax=Labrus mixtus TaxID=508554 RepID=UPI0029C0243E|nr:uncharacterized protein C16orf46 homolog [Labrus mixtus]XP_060897278.1 uncharacterized protein C16orf46 homolog [Labrus mixtus]